MKTPFSASVIRRWVAVAALAAAFAAGAAPVRVELRRTPAGEVELWRGGERYFIRGAGAESRIAELAAAGANSVRTWGTEQTEAVIDEAGRLGLTVCAGLWIEHERRGFDYDDPVAVRAQIERHCRAVDRFKDHPALLFWSVGNEVEGRARNPKVWDVIEAVAAYIKRVDPHHPVMTVTAHAPAEAIAEIRRRCPSVDVLGCNSYGGLPALARDVRAAGWTGPYVVTEWGNDGNWEAPKTPWGAELEPTSTEKARVYAARYPFLTGDAARCLGGYAFFWGQKQETTPTWFNLFTEQGDRTEAVEVLQEKWTGRPAPGLAPRIAPLALNGRAASAGVRVRPGAPLVFSTPLLRGEAGTLTAEWELQPESAHKGFGGDAEVRPASVPLPAATGRIHDGRVTLECAAPAAPGAYRLYLVVRGPGHTAATANFPFFVE